MASACNDIDEANRYIQADSVKPMRAVLIEDFTGQNCVNCPSAHKTIELLSEQYGDAIIPVAIHAGGFGVPVGYRFYTGLMQPEGDTYNDAWGINEWPKGVINRRGAALTPDEWAQTVRQELETPTTLAISADATCSNNKININLEFRPTDDVNGNLQVWITEDKIIARQESLEGRIKEYEHNHVYRASVNGVGGEPIALEANIHRNVTMSCDVRNNDGEVWNTENLSVVAFVYNSNGVLQATRCQVVPTSAEE